MRQNQARDGKLKNLTLRLPDEIHSEISEVARDEGRSFTAQVIRILRDFLIARKKREQKTITR